VDRHPNFHFDADPDTDPFRIRIKIVLGLSASGFWEPISRLEHSVMIWIRLRNETSNDNSPKYQNLFKFDSKLVLNLNIFFKKLCVFPWQFRQFLLAILIFSAGSVFKYYGSGSVSPKRVKPYRMHPEHGTKLSSVSRGKDDIPEPPLSIVIVSCIPGY
jgi:hypothetical protein